MLIVVVLLATGWLLFLTPPDLEDRSQSSVRPGPSLVEATPSTDAPASAEHGREAGAAEFEAPSAARPQRPEGTAESSSITSIIDNRQTATYGQIEIAAARVRLEYKALLREIEREIPDLSVHALDYEAAASLSASGGLVLALSGANHGETGVLYVPCPREYADRVGEMRNTVLDLMNAPDCIRSMKSQVLKYLPEDSADQVVDAVPFRDGSGFALVDVWGNSVKDVHYNVPGLVH